MRSNTYVLKVPEGEFFDVHVKHYSLVDTQTLSDLNTPITLFLAHGIGLHKELYEPFLDDLARLQSESQESLSFVVTDAWAIDCPNHGESALLNEEKLKSSCDRFTSPADYAQCFLALLESDLMPDIASRYLVLLGHSAGATSAVLTIEEIIRRKRPVQFSALILVECPLLGTPVESGSEKNEKWIEASPVFVKLLNGKQDKWQSREIALDSMSKSSPYNKWDKRVLDLFIEHGIRELPTWFYPNETGVTLRCYKFHETQGFSDYQSTLAMVSALPNICTVMPVHLVFAERSFLRPSNEEIDLLAAGKDDKYPCDKYASVALIPRAGHLAPQDAPSAVAESVLNALNTQKEDKHEKQRL